jgi:hypothetical protein
VDTYPVVEWRCFIMKRHRNPYPDEFRQKLIDLVHAGRNSEELAQEFEPTSQISVQFGAQNAASSQSS